MRIEFIQNAEDLDAGDLLGRLSNTVASHIVVSYTQKCKNLRQFVSSIGYWWKPICTVDTEDSGLLVLKRKTRGIEDIDTYKALRNYYWSERLAVGSYMIHELETIRFISRACSDVKLVVELGGYHGGLTLQLSDSFPNAEIHSFDIRLFGGMEKILDVVCPSKSNITFHKENVLLGKNADVLDLLGRDGRKFLYCDNGNKIAEMRRYAPYLNKGDILGVHDWNVEISRDKVKKTLDNFTSIFHDELVESGLLTRLWKRL